MKILVVEDHPKIRQNIVKYLNLKGFRAEDAIHGEDAKIKLSTNNYDLIVIDINMPLLDGKEFTKLVRKTGNNIPIIALTSNSLLNDKLEMFSFGVDDYLTKPFEFEELEARIKALLKRKDKDIEDIIKFKDISLDIGKHKVYKKSKEIELGNKEYLILEYLLSNKNYPKSKVSILEKVWGEQEENLDLGSKTLEAHISTLRKKLGRDLIKTIKGVGYVIE
ncbi:response regulator [Candidatus Gracilibacteria bacterium]|nr:response regulator [Candidatus Gracilibacteria bacterium]